MKISTSLDYAADFDATTRLARDLEAAGVDRIWVAEAYGFDAVSMLGYLAAVTDRVELASGILPVYSRTPALIAQTAAGLDALSGGRFVLGLGASGPQVVEGWHGVPYDLPLTRINEIIDICRSAWKRERLVHDGRAYTLPLPPDRGTGLGKPLKMITHPVRDDIPIHIAALGPKSVQATVARADGWLPLFFAPEIADRVWGDARRAGEAERDPSRPPVEITSGGLLAIGPDAHQMRDLARPMMALYIGGMGARGKNFYNDVCRDYGFADEAALVQDLYLDGKRDEAAAALPDELVEKTTLCGDEAYIRDRLAAFADAGVTSLNVTPIGGDPVTLIAALRDLTS